MLEVAHLVVAAVDTMPALSRAWYFEGHRDTAVIQIELSAVRSTSSAVDSLGVCVNSQDGPPSKLDCVGKYCLATAAIHLAEPNQMWAQQGRTVDMYVIHETTQCAAPAGANTSLASA